MEIRRWLYCAVNCALVCYIVAKPFSLNKLIDSESTHKVSHTTVSPKVEEPEPAAERFSLNKGLKPFNRIAKKFKETDTKLHLIPLGKKISPLKYRREFQIKSPLKPKRVKTSLRTRHKRKNQSFKREIDSNALLNKKYVPLLRSLTMLFDNILGTDSGESYEIKQHKKRLRYYPDGDDDVSCACTQQKSSTRTESEEETITFTEALPAQVAATTQVTATITHNTSAGNISSFRHNKNIPVLLSRNTSGARRNDHGVGERGSAPYYGRTERNFTRNHGNSKYLSEHEQEQSYAKSNEDYTDSDSRHGAGRVRTRGTVRGREYGNNTEEIYEDKAKSQDETEKLLDESRNDISQHNGADKLKNKRNQAKSGKFLSESVREQRKLLYTDEVADLSESVQSKDNYKESVVSIPVHGPGNQRFVDGDSSYSSEIKKISAKAEAKIGNVPLETKGFMEKSADNAKVKDLVGNFTLTIQDETSGENDTNVSYDTFKGSPHTDDSMEISTKPELHLAPIVNKHVVNKHVDINKKLNALTSNSAEIIHAEGTTTGRTKHINYGPHKNNTFFSRQLPKRVSESHHKPPELENSIHLSKSNRSSRSQGPLVMIIDGYSVTRHKNGENKLAEKTIRIRP